MANSSSAWLHMLGPICRWLNSRLLVPMPCGLMAARSSCKHWWVSSACHCLSWPGRWAQLGHWCRQRWMATSSVRRSRPQGPQLLTRPVQQLRRRSYMRRAVTAQPTVDVPSTPIPPGGTEEPSLPPPPTATATPGIPSPSPAPAPRANGPVFLPLVTRIDPPLLCSDIEDNDSPAQARLLSPIGPPCQASFRDDPEGEDDYYQIELQADQQVQIDLTQMPSGADYDLILYNSDLAQLAVSNRSGVANERVVYTAGVAGTYLIRINMARESTSATNNYTLQAQLR